MVATTFSQYLVNLWIHSYSKNRVATVTVTFVGVLVFAIGLTFAAREDMRDRQRQAGVTVFYEAQVAELARMEASLRALTGFISERRLKLRESQAVVSSLQTEQAKLRPLVEADRRTVQAILQFQNDQARRSATQERWIGFGLGVLASVVASIIYGVASFLVARRATSRT